MTLKIDMRDVHKSFGAKQEIIRHRKNTQPLFCIYHRSDWTMIQNAVV